MKYLITALMAFAALAFAGCGPKAEVLPATQNLPTFSDSAVNDYVKNYAQLANEYVTALKAKDYSKVSTLSQKVSEAGTKVSTYLSNLKGDEVKKLQDWLSTVSQQMADAASRVAK